jgi:hypothetical protein
MQQRDMRGGVPDLRELSGLVRWQGALSRLLDMMDSVKGGAGIMTGSLDQLQSFVLAMHWNTERGETLTW